MIELYVALKLYCKNIYEREKVFMDIFTYRTKG